MNSIKFSRHHTLVTSLSNFAYAYVERPVLPGQTAKFIFEIVKSVDCDIYVGIACFDVEKREVNSKEIHYKETVKREW